MRPLVFGAVFAMISGCVLDRAVTGGGGNGGNGGSAGSGGNGVCGNGQVESGEDCDGSVPVGTTCETLGFPGGIVACSVACDFDTQGCVTCGDGTKNGGDVCDGADLGGATCQTEVAGSPGGTLACKADCTGYDTAQCQPPPTCNDGVQQPMEDCEGADLYGATCMSVGFDGGTLACNANCTFDTNGCFTCGDGTKNGAEQCDGGDLGGATCVSLGADGGTLACAANCTYNVSGCNTCGDGTITAPEVCDGPNLGGATCASQGFDSGTLACAPSCAAFVTSGCGDCGDGIKNGTEQCDGGDLGGASCVTLGFGSGTLSCSACAHDTSKCATCGDGALGGTETCDDGNAANGDGCTSTCTIEQPAGCNLSAFFTVPLGTFSYSGDNSGNPGVSPDASCGAGTGKKLELALRPTSAGFLTLTLPRATTSFDAVLVARATCNSNTNAVCADSYDPNTNMGLDGGEVISFEVTANTTYFVLVEGYAAGDEGPFELLVDLSAGTCADPIPITIYPGTPMDLFGNSVGDGADGQGSCGGGPGAPDVTYAVHRSANGTIGATLTSGWNKSLYARSQCASGELACSNAGGNNAETIAPISFPDPNATVFYWVDGNSGAGDGGQYTLTLTP